MGLHDHHWQLMVHPDFRLFGIRMRPLSVGHAKLLPALGMDHPGTLEEFAACALVCAVPARVALRRLRSSWWRRWYAFRGFIAGILTALACGRSGAARAVLALGMAETWGQYLAHYNHAPPAVPVTGDGMRRREVATPNLAHVEHALCECGLAPQDVEEMPLNEALWRYGVAKEAAGEVALVDSTEDYEAEQAFADENAERWLAIANGKDLPPC